MSEENETTQNPEDITPIEVPSAVAETDFTGLEGESRDQFLDALFGTGDDAVPTDDVGGIAADIAAEIISLNGDRTPANVDRMETLARYLDVVESEMSRRGDRQAELDARAEEIASRFGGEGETSETLQDGGDADEEEEDPEETAVEGETPDADVAPTEAARVRPSGSGLAAALGIDAQTRQRSNARPTGATVLTDDVQPIVTPEAQALARLSVQEDPATMIATQDAVSSWAKGVAAGSEITDLTQLGTVFWGKWKAMSGKHGTIRDNRIPLVSCSLDYGERGLGDDPMKNFGVFATLRSDVQVITASGGSCAPAAPRYDIFQLATPHSPVEDNLPVIGAPRGSIRFVVPPDFRDMRSGIGVITDAQDRAGYGSGSGQATPKPCVHVDCPEIAECVVTTISSCIEFGNLTFETFPEFVAARLRDLATNFAQVKEVFYLDQIDAGSITRTDSASYGLSRSLPLIVGETAWNYRKRNGMDVDAVLDWFAPDWVAQAHVLDKRNDFSEGATMGTMRFSDATAEYESLGLNVVWYYDSATGEGQAFTDMQADGPGNPFPTRAVWYLFAPGTFIRLDAGTLDLGIVRDSVLNRTNDLQIFAEQWIQVCKLGIESIKGVTTDLCPSGGAPAAVAVLTCPAAS